tara:strand:+ start:105 stop:551 length:447 start_codon:yes stop_codon:yes gene_type:complete
VEKLLLNKKQISFYFIILLLMVNSVHANYAFKKKIKSVCSSYRVSVNTSSMDLDTDLFSLNLESNRNNFEMVLLVGFASAGQAVSHQKSLGLSNSYIPNEIMVKVNVPASKGETMIFEAVCSSEMAMQLAAGTLDSSDFMQKINLVTS